MAFARDYGDVVVEQLDDKNWEMRSQLVYEGNRDTFTVPVGFRTDFASVPRPFVWFLPRYGRYTKAAILHDYLWRDRAQKGQLPWRDADALFRRAMHELKVPFLRRWIMWSAVRWAALTKPKGRQGFLRDLWRLLLASLIAAPFVLPAAAVILVSLAVFYVFERIVWVFLELSRRMRSTMGRPATPGEVNAPSFDLSTS